MIYVDIFLWIMIFVYMVILVFEIKQFLKFRKEHNAIHNQLNDLKSHLDQLNCEINYYAQREIEYDNFLNTVNTLINNRSNKKDE